MPKGVYERKPGLKRNQPARPVAGRFWEKVNKTSTCWLWTGARSSAGYGTFNLGRRGQGYTYAHRWAYQNTHGEIPKGQHLDHLCRVTRCVNPDHLEIVSPKENMLRGYSPGARVRRQGTCMKGHGPEHWYWRKDGKWNCRECRRERGRS